MTYITIDQTLCVGCRECAKVCPADAIQGLPGQPQSIDPQRCVMCGQCVQKCKSYIAPSFDMSHYTAIRRERSIPQSVLEPLFAAHFQSQLPQVKAALQDPQTVCFVQCAPSVRVGIEEEFGGAPGSLVPGKLSAALHRLGFDYVFDTNFAADLTVVEEGTELIHRILHNENLPMFTSCCPAWITWLERNHPDLTKHLSSCKSPQQMAGALFKTYAANRLGIASEKIVSIAVMPCTCKEFESQRPEMNASGYRDVDVVITTRELAWLIKEAGISFATLPDQPFDSPLGEYSGAGALFGATGGVMEAALRTGYELVTGEKIPAIDVSAARGSDGFRTAEVDVGDLKLRIGIVTGLEHVKPVIQQLQAGALDLHFIEVMACPQGCISGGGQPKLLVGGDAPLVCSARTASIYAHDRALPLRRAHENPALQELYQQFLEHPGGTVSHRLLHTKYKEP